MDAERKPVGAPVVVSGRVEELRLFEAGERALAHAWSQYAHAVAASAYWLELADRHRAFAEALAARVVALGGDPRIDPDDQWISGPTTELATLVRAEEAAMRTYVDHLIDLDPASQQVARCIVEAHERIVTELTGVRPVPELLEL